MAREWYTLTGNVVQEAYFEPYGAHAGGSPDGLVGELGIIEIKCPFRTVNHLGTAWRGRLTTCRRNTLADTNELALYWPVVVRLRFV